jgi:hypothetical protein
MSFRASGGQYFRNQEGTPMNRMIALCSLVAAACGGSAKPAVEPSSSQQAAPAVPPGPPAYTAYVHGPLAKQDLASARVDHDRLAGGSQESARAAGDRGHHVLLGTGEPAGGQDEFLALDEWQSLDGPRTVYGDPKFQAAFGALFAKPVAPELYKRRPDWHTWGDLNGPSTGGPYWVVIVKGHLAKATEAENKAAHDAIANGFEKIARQSGDIAHVPHIAIDDPRVFFNVDVSTSHEGALAMLQNPDFQKAFGALFDAPPEVHIYRATNWTQW